MDLEKAYNKVDNLCCLNHNVVTITNIDIEHGRVPKKIDFFEGYNETKDDDFCKDANEMMDALETIKEVVDLQKELGCSFKVLYKMMKQEKINFMGAMVSYYVFYNLITNRFEIRNEETMELIPLADYKKFWWLKEDRSE